MAQYRGRRLKIVRVPDLPDLGRYYDDTETIALRGGMLLEKEREVLWHELRHHARRDRACHTDARTERLVDRQAAQDAMPWVSIEWAWSEAIDLTEMAGLLKLPEEWVHRRLMDLSPAEKARLRVRADQFA